MAIKDEYLKLLAEYGLSEDKVKPIIRPEYWSDKDKLQFVAMKRSLEPNFLDQYEKFRAPVLSPSPISMLNAFLAPFRQDDAREKFKAMESGNANLLIEAIANSLKRRLNDNRLPTPEVEVFHGVFPTRIFNAQVAKRGTGYLVLLESEVLGMTEAVAVLATRQSISPDTAANDLMNICTAYADRIGLPLKKRYETQPVEEFQHYYTDNSSQEDVINLVTAAEEFAIAHEWGHLILGHALSGTVCALPGSGVGEDNPKTSLEQSWLDEFMADIWAIAMLMKSVGDKAKSTTLAGAVLFLSLGELIEYQFGPQADQLLSHPLALSRMWMVNSVANKFGVRRIKGGIEAQVESLFQNVHQRQFGTKRADIILNEQELIKIYNDAMSYLFPYDKLALRPPPSHWKKYLPQRE